MSKIKKENTKSRSANKKPKLEEKSAFRSVILSAVIGGVLLISSFLLNGIYPSLFLSANILIQTLNITTRVLVILFFFIFMTISLGNYKELTGKPLNIKFIAVIFIVSLIQSFRDTIVFSFTFVGLLIIIVYLIFIQEN